jgi:hypothetical protein
MHSPAVWQVASEMARYQEAVAAAQAEMERLRLALEEERQRAAAAAAATLQHGGGFHSAGLMTPHTHAYGGDIGISSGSDGTMRTPLSVRACFISLACCGAPAASCRAET